MSELDKLNGYNTKGAKANKTTDYESGLWKGTKFESKDEAVHAASVDYVLKTLETAEREGRLVIEELTDEYISQLIIDQKQIILSSLNRATARDSRRNRFSALGR